MLRLLQSSIFFQQGTADVLLLGLNFDVSLSQSDTVVFFLNFSKQSTQNTCNVQFIELFYLLLKYGIYNLLEVKKSYKEARAYALVSLSDFHLPRFIIPIFLYRTINKLYACRSLNHVLFTDLCNVVK